MEENTLKKDYGKVDWLLLVFLLLFTNQAIFSLKIVGLMFICLVRWNWDFKTSKGRLSKFFIFILVLAGINFLFFVREFTRDYIVAFVVGNLFWVFSFISSHQVKLSLEKYGHSGIYRTMKVFVTINFLFCIGQLVRIMFITGTINPYNEQLSFPYGMSTGDNIFGSFMQNSYYNVMVSSLLSIYFLFKRNIFFSVLACTCMILVFGNFGTLVFIGILIALFFLGLLASVIGNAEGGIFKWVQQISPPGRYYFYIPGLICISFLFYIVLSPKNLEYIVKKFQDTILTNRSSEKNNYGNMITDQTPLEVAFDPFTNYFDKLEESQKITDVLEKVQDGDNSADNILKARKELTDGYIRRLQGKNLSVIETISYLKSSPSAFLLGAGTTRFSSLIAQKMSGYDSSRLFMNVLPHYKSKPYAENHYLLIDGRETAGDDALLSTANWPDSLYNQLFGEYGVLGALIFFIYYLGFYAKRIRFWTYSFWMMCIFLPFAHLNYIFDTLCVIPFFELLIEANISENSEIDNANA